MLICEEDPPFCLDVTDMGLPDDLVPRLAPQLAQAFARMAELEAGAIANPDEGRRVGHYWLRAPERAPEPALQQAIVAVQARIGDFAARVRRGEIQPAGRPLRELLLVGIGGSALGPQLLATALADDAGPLRPHFLDNTDPDGIDRILGRIAAGAGLAATLVVVTSKSGSTPETRNGQLEVAAALRRAGLEPARHLVAITGEGSPLERQARQEGWLATFPMWDWVGGRTSVMSAVGLLPAALLGLDVQALLAGARQMDELTRRPEATRNPAALLALCWLHAKETGRRDMVVLPYKDRLELFPRYLQQLVMESLGKELDLSGRRVLEGLAVYGNKGSTDQHAYVQQLRDGLDQAFVTFIEVLRDRQGPSLFVEPEVTSGDYLLGFLLGTRAALRERGRPSLTLTVPDVSARSLGMLIALFERAVGLYAFLVGINAYHQPGVEAGKRAAAAVLALQRRLLAALSDEPETAGELAARIGEPDVRTAAAVLRHLAANDRIVLVSPGGPLAARYRRKQQGAEAPGRP
ncbi:MAG: glucose-6-phosphate isomerase [Myxococcales bacterium]|nr:glucose-6-phosphate isomerase [Myxococcota bacterium]MDW8280381.1 glucose-6-phosphate isomerase [Myxococcales bacterium]